MNNPANDARPSSVETINLECHPANISEGRYVVCNAGDVSVLVCRSAGRLHAIENRCSHMGMALAGGRLIGERIICPEHGAAFDMKTGEAAGFPAVFPVRNFTVNEHENWISVCIRSPE